MALEIFLALISIILILYLLYLGGMSWGRYHELKNKKAKLDKETFFSYVEYRGYLSFLWLLGIKKMPPDQKLRGLVKKQRIVVFILLILIVTMFLLG